MTSNYRIGIPEYFTWNDMKFPLRFVLYKPVTISFTSILSLQWKLENHRYALQIMGNIKHSEGIKSVIAGTVINLQRQSKWIIRFDTRCTSGKLNKLTFILLFIIFFFFIISVALPTSDDEPIC